MNVEKKGEKLEGNIGCDTIIVNGNYEIILIVINRRIQKPYIKNYMWAYINHEHGLQYI